MGLTSKEKRRCVAPTQSIKLRLLEVLYRPAAMAACASAVGWLAAADSWATCGSVVETCGDGVDNDCDGAADEGCGCLTALTTAPFAFSSSTELRRRMGQDGKPVRNNSFPQSPTTLHRPYGQVMHNRWSIATGPLAAMCRFHFPMFELNAGDSLSIGSWTGSELLAPYTTSTAWNTPLAASAWLPTTDKLQAAWVTGAQAGTNRLGFIASEIQCACLNPTSTPNWHSVAPNEPLDGAFLFPKDDIYVRVEVPAGRNLYINVDQIAVPNQAPADFDVTFSTNGSMPAPNDCGGSMSACTNSTVGEAGFVPANMTSSQIVSIRVHAKTGSGRFRLVPVVSKTEIPTVIGQISVGVDRNVYGTNWEKPRVEAILAGAANGLLAAADGQIGPFNGWRIDNDAPWYVTRLSYHVWFGEDTTLCSGDALGCCTACLWPFSPWTGVAQLSRKVWRGEKEAGTDGTVQGAADILTHELGHLILQLPDEYVKTNGKTSGRACTHSLMAGAGGMRYARPDVAGDSNAFELCGPGNHGAVPQTAAGAGGDSNWTRAQSVYPDVEPPAFNGASISNDFSQLKAIGSNLAKYTFYSWE